MNTNVYIDGFNLYYGCLKGTPHKWLDLGFFCQASFPPPRNQINRIRYFTAHVNARANNPQQRVRQQTYLRALRTIQGGHEIAAGGYLAFACLPLAGDTDRCQRDDP
jgi:hypothetical protein